MKLTEEFIEGVFVSENKRRFLCRVLIEGEIEECYIPCSSRINSFINLKSKKVLLTANKGLKAKTRYSLFAVKYYDKYILLNSNIANKVLAEDIDDIANFEDLPSKIQTEKYVGDYKADLILYGKEAIIIEAKSIIGVNRVVNFPNVYMKRAAKQLKMLKELLLEGYRIEYYFVSLSPIVKTVIIDEYYKEYKELLTACIDNGLVIKGITLNYIDGEIKVKRNLNIKI